MQFENLKNHGMQNHFQFSTFNFQLSKRYPDKNTLGRRVGRIVVANLLEPPKRILPLYPQPIVRPEITPQQIRLNYGLYIARA